MFDYRINRTQSMVELDEVRLSSTTEDSISYAGCIAFQIYHEETVVIWLTCRPLMLACRTGKVLLKSSYATRPAYARISNVDSVMFVDSNKRDGRFWVRNPTFCEGQKKFIQTWFIEVDWNLFFRPCVYIYLKFFKFFGTILKFTVSIPFLFNTFL